MNYNKRNFTNLEIYGISKGLSEAFNEDSRYLPALINFYIQKNRSIFASLGQEIEQVRNDLIQKNGIYDEEEGSYSIPKEKLNFVNQELYSIMELEQEVKYFTISYTELEGLELTTQQMQAILFMIDSPIDNKGEKGNEIN